ncbi:MAG: biotin--[acetyl-CoA-carboxylase] ligase [Treponema sp.]|nr:biotin--[acetyl-CoA-carboxylase] ligase [Treponema sp.]
MKVLSLKNPFGASIYHEETLSSTFDRARLLYAQGAASGTVILADFQEAGKGRLGRSWKAQRGMNLLFTIILIYEDPALIPRALSLKTGLAVCLAIEDLAPSLKGCFQLKWPNDVMILNPGDSGAFKVGGILIEAEGPCLYLGVGINVAQREFPDDLSPKAGSLIQVLPDLGPQDRFRLLELILPRLRSELEVPPEADTWREAIGERLYMRGEMLSFAPGAAGSAELVEGTLSGIGPGGELLLIPRGEAEERAFLNGELRVY